MTKKKVVVEKEVVKKASIVKKAPIVKKEPKVIAKKVDAKVVDTKKVGKPIPVPIQEMNRAARIANGVQ